MGKILYLFFATDKFTANICLNEPKQIVLRQLFLLSYILLVVVGGALVCVVGLTVEAGKVTTGDVVGGSVISEHLSMLHETDSDWIIYSELLNKANVN